MQLILAMLTQVNNMDKVAKKWVLLGIIILACLLGYGVYHYLHPSKPAANPLATMKVGVVDLDKALKVHPSYKDYEALQQELANMQSSYESEQDHMGEEYAQKAQAAASDRASRLDQMEKGLTDSLNTELQSRIKAKENELNEALEKQYHEWMVEAVKQLPTGPNPLDLRIVNLQLALAAQKGIVPIDAAQAKRFEEDRKAKEAELEKLLQEQKQPIDMNLQKIEADVRKRMEPVAAKSHEELAAYADAVMKELMGKRDTMMQTATQAMAEEEEPVDMPNASEWNADWQDKLQQKQDELDTLYEAMIEDIRTRTAVVAKEKGLDLVVTHQVSNVNAVDITDNIITSYLK